MTDLYFDGLDIQVEEVETDMFKITDGCDNAVYVGLEVLHLIVERGQDALYLYEVSRRKHNRGDKPESEGVEHDRKSDLHKGN